MEENAKDWLDGIEDRAVEAYKSKGLKATQGFFYPVDGKGACCALGALYGDDVDPGYEYTKKVIQATGADERRIWSFIYAFDAAIQGRTPYVYPGHEAECDAAERVAKRVIAEGLLA